MDEKKLVKFLEDLAPTDFNRILARIPEAAIYVPEGVNHLQRVYALLHYVRSSAGPRQEKLQEVVQELFSQAFRGEQDNANIDQQQQPNTPENNSSPSIPATTPPKAEPSATELRTENGEASKALTENSQPVIESAKQSGSVRDSTQQRTMLAAGGIVLGIVALVIIAGFGFTIWNPNTTEKIQGPETPPTALNLRKNESLEYILIGETSSNQTLTSLKTEFPGDPQNQLSIAGDFFIGNGKLPPGVQLSETETSELIGDGNIRIGKQWSRDDKSILIDAKMEDVTKPAEHYRADTSVKLYPYIAIEISLIGPISQKGMSPAQAKTLKQLVRKLMADFNIPAGNIRASGEIGGPTELGKTQGFDIQKFRQEMKKNEN